MLYSAFFCCVLIIHQVCCSQPSHSQHSKYQGYYWREYTGSPIPNDAFVAGKDINSRNIYIGQAYVRGHGVFPVAIYSDKKGVEVAAGGVKKIDGNVKILCGSQDRFKWLRTTGTNLHRDLIEKRPIMGGYDVQHRNLHVGRIFFRGELRVGKIEAFNVGNSLMWFPVDNSQMQSKLYDVLYYE